MENNEKLVKEQQSIPPKRVLKRMKTREKIWKLGTESYVHGISKITSSRSMKRKVFWGVLLLCGFACAIAHLTILTIRYLEFGTYYITDDILDADLYFPAVTICPKVVDIQHTKLLYKHQSFQGRRIRMWVNKFLPSLKIPSDLYKHFHSWTGIIENHPEFLQYNILKCDEILLHCSFQGKPCSCRNFDEYVDLRYRSKCYTFNVTTMYEKGKTKFTHGGPGNALSLTLGLERSTYEKAFFSEYDHVPFRYDLNHSYDYSNGFTVQIHPHDTIPTPFNHGMNIPTALSTTIALKAKVKKKLSHPYSNCSDDNLKLSKTTYKRTLFTCKLVCKQQRIIDECGCMSSRFPALNKSVPYCGRLKNWMGIDKLTEKERETRIQEITKPWKCEKKLREEHVENCNCVSCDEESLDHHLSITQWPDDEYVPNLLEELYGKLHHGCDLRTVYESINESAWMKIKRSDANVSDVKVSLPHGIRKAQHMLARVNIYLEDLDAMLVQEVASYPVTNLMADVGGALGLWIGISILSLMEIFEVLFMAICSMKRDRREKEEIVEK